MCLIISYYIIFKYLLTWHYQINDMTLLLNNKKNYFENNKGYKN